MKMKDFARLVLVELVVVHSRSSQRQVLLERSSMRGWRLVLILEPVLEMAQQTIHLTL